MPSPELRRDPILGETYSIKTESPFCPERSHLKGMEIGCSSEFGEALETAILKEHFTAEGLREALAGITLSFSLEHVPRLVHDQVTIGRDIYSAQSWRYVTMHLKKGDISRIHPPECLRNTKLEKQFLELTALSISAYDRMVELGILEEDARYVNLWSFDSNIVVTLQGPKLVDFAIDNLNSPYQVMRNVAEEVIATFAQEFPLTAKNLENVAMREGISIEDRMRIEEMRATYLHGYGEEIVIHPLNVDPTKRAAVAARTCYQELPPSEFADSLAKETQERILSQTISSGHTSVVEHPHFLIQSAMSEANLQQIRRHRIPVQRAMAMWLAAREYQVVIPPSIQSDEEALRLYLEVWNESKTFIEEAIQAGFPAPELDHAVIVGIKVPFFLVTNVTDLLHISKRRLCQRAQWESRDWMYQVAEVLIKNWPELFESLGPNCYQGKCQEKDCCGHPEIYRNWRKTIS